MDTGVQLSFAGETLRAEREMGTGREIHWRGAIYERTIDDLAHFANRVRTLRLQLRIMTEKYFEPLERRNSTAYGTAYSLLRGYAPNGSALLFGEDFDQKFSVEIDFVPMMRKENESEFFVAEKTTFHYLHDFLRTEFYRGLAIGNAPRLCHNCGKYFLLTDRLQHMLLRQYCTRRDGANLPEGGSAPQKRRAKANRSPARVEYDRKFIIG